MSRSDLLREALRQQALRETLALLHEELAPQARAAGWLTEDRILRKTSRSDLASPTAFNKQMAPPNSKPSSCHRASTDTRLRCSAAYATRHHCR